MFLSLRTGLPTTKLSLIRRSVLATGIPTTGGSAAKKAKYPPTTMDDLFGAPLAQPPRPAARGGQHVLAAREMCRDTRYNPCWRTLALTHLALVHTMSPTFTTRARGPTLPNWGVEWPKHPTHDQTRPLDRYNERPTTRLFYHQNACPRNISKDEILLPS